MTRWVGALLLSAGAAALGLGAVAHLDGRVRDLRGLVAGLDAMERALTARLAPLEEMLLAAEKSTQGRPEQFFRTCRQKLQSLGGHSFSGLWDAVLDTEPLRLEEGDFTVLRQLGPVLGRYDGDSQGLALTQAARQLEQQLAEASDQRKRLGRVYGTMGVTAGLFLTILLI